jgi:hypothetical protein
MVHAFMSGNYGVSHFLHLRLVSQGVMSIMARSNQGGSVVFSSRVAGLRFLRLN